MAFIGLPCPRNNTGIASVLLNDVDIFSSECSFIAAPVNGNMASDCKNCFLFMVYEISLNNDFFSGCSYSFQDKKKIPIENAKMHTFCRLMTINS
jgi:hypothetical protein